MAEGHVTEVESNRTRLEEWFESSIIHPLEDFQDPRQEWRRLFSELLGTFFLVLVAAGGGMMGQAFPDTIGRSAAVSAPGLMVMAIILFMGKVSGAHLNPAVSLAFAARGDFPWRRVPGYIVVQLPGPRWRRCSSMRSSTCRRSTGRTTRHRVFVGCGVLDGVHPDVGTRECDLGNGVGGAEHGDRGGVRGGWLHRVGGPVG